MRVAIADDELTCRVLLDRLLKKHGHEVVAACDGTQAWDVLCQEDAPRLAVLDWQMPGIDGIELCRRIRRKEDSVPIYVILLTAMSDKDRIIEGLSAGANDYIVKPFDTGELLARVEVGARFVGLQNALAAKIHELEDALTHIKALQGILPICMHCHRIRTDEESWQRIEGYIEAHSDAHFSHGLCPECLEKYYPEASAGNEDDLGALVQKSLRE